MKTNFKIYFVLASILFIICETHMNIQTSQIEQLLSSISDDALDSLSTKKIYFGHMSVGFNIMDGVEKIISNNERFQKIRIYELSPTDMIGEPGIFHARNGKNGFPKTKCDAFLNFLRKGKFSEKLDIAFFKFCYVDIERDYDIQKLFTYYLKTIKKIKEEFPNIKIIHITVPLAAHKWGLRGFIKNLLIGDIENVKRNQFNELLINEFKNVDPIYNLAEIESRYLDGKRSSFKYRGKIYYSLAKFYTHDGGHLNEIGRSYAAGELLRVLTNAAKN